MRNEIVTNNESNSKVFVSFLLVLVLLLAGYIVYDKFISGEGTVEETEKTNDTSKKGYVYDANYTYNVSKESYSPDFGVMTIRAKDLIVPFINIDSEDAKKANDELYQLHKKLVEYYEEDSKEGIAYFTVDYRFYENKEILSVVVKTEDAGRSAPSINYFTYNFDINSGKILTYEQTYAKLGFLASNIDSRVKELLKSEVDYKFITGNVLEDEMINKANSYKQTELKYIDSVENNTTKFFVPTSTSLVILAAITGDERSLSSLSSSSTEFIIIQK